MSIRSPRTPRRPGALGPRLHARHIQHSLAVKTGSLEVEPARLERGLERLREVLSARALKMSKVREAIALAALAYDGHFSVEDLLRALHDHGVRDVHLATVYRAVPLMLEAGLIQPALPVTAEGQHYEANFEREHHDHLVCTTCGRVVEYHSEALGALEREIARIHGFELEDHTLELRGQCRACRRGD
jgi:Fur family transcriptional regulator, ferric uptake regulator